MDRQWLPAVSAARSTEGTTHSRSGVAALDTFEPLGVSHIESWSVFDGHDARELTDFDGVHIGRGNTCRLLQQVRTSGFDKAITRFIGEGRSTAEVPERSSSAMTSTQPCRPQQ